LCCLFADDCRYAHLSTARLQELDPDVPVLTAEAAIERGFQGRVAADEKQLPQPKQ
jgi:hypothetical protein